VTDVSEPRATSPAIEEGGPEPARPSGSGRFPADRTTEAARRAKLTIAGRERTGFGQPMPVPAWAVSVVGGAIAAPLAAILRPWVSPAAVAGDVGAPGTVVAFAIYGAACGALATITTGRTERRIAVLGTVAGAAIGGIALLSSAVHEAFILAAFVAVVSLPSALVARALRLPLRQAMPLWTLSLLSVGAGGIPIGYSLFMANRWALHLRGHSISFAIAAALGILAWYRPASYRPGSRG
jgi:hypothetical protein